MNKILVALLIVLVSFSSSLIAYELNDISTMPTGFPQFKVPNYQNEMNSIRNLFYHHYFWNDYPTMWDFWMPMSLCWVGADNDSNTPVFTNAIRDNLNRRHIDSQGYISTQQHTGLGHPHGWPFPLWEQAGGIGWYFNLKGMAYGPEVNVKWTPDIKGWKFEGIENITLTQQTGLKFDITENNASFKTPDFNVKGLASPFVVLYWSATGIQDSKCSLEVTTSSGSVKKMNFYPADSQERTYATIPLHKIISQDQIITSFKVNILNAKGASIKISLFHTAVDSRQQINNFAFIRGSCDYINWTGDLNFLRKNIGKIRKALRYAITEFQVEKYNCVNVPWVGHDGRSGIQIDEKGNKKITNGLGVGGNYYDLLPFGGKDFYVTMYCYNILNSVADLEQAIAQNPQWNIPSDAMMFQPKQLRTLAEKIKKFSNKFFWNKKTKRFVSSVDINGKSYDYGFIFINLEAVYYNFATKQHAKEIMDWITGKRIVKNDTSTGADIYKWKFAPRATTLRNIDYYCFVWYLPETLEFGEQIQDGGAALAWSFQDMMARINVYGPDNASKRLKEITQWFNDVQAQGGYRAYYSKPNRGNLQGGGTAGGLGLDQEFVENVLVPQAMLYGFAGIKPALDSLTIQPDLPTDWPHLTITNIDWHDNLMDITVSDNEITIKMKKIASDKIVIIPSAGKWQVIKLDKTSKKIGDSKTVKSSKNCPTLTIDTNSVQTIKMKKI